MDQQLAKAKCAELFRSLCQVDGAWYRPPHLPGAANAATMKAVVLPDNWHHGWMSSRPVALLAATA